MAELQATTQLSRSYIYKLMALDKFPKPINYLGINVWLAEEVGRWIDTQLQQGIDQRQQNLEATR